ncbi:MAG: L,D-transpeptidase [Polyangiaceae bacterium]
MVRRGVAGRQGFVVAAGVGLVLLTTLVASSCTEPQTPVAMRERGPDDTSDASAEIASESEPLALIDAGENDAEITDASVVTQSRDAGPVYVDGEAIRIFSGYEEIRDEPNAKSVLVGLARAGQIIRLLDKKPVEKPGSPCKGGWYSVLPYGYVCVGLHSSLDVDEPEGKAAAELFPDLTRDLPYRVGFSTGAPRYRRVPTSDELAFHEPFLAKHLANPPAPDEHGAIDLSHGGDEMSSLLAAITFPKSAKTVYDDRAFPGMKLSWSREFDVSNRTWLATSDGALVPRDRVRITPQSKLHGIDLTAPNAPKLPLAFVPGKGARRFKRDTTGAMIETGTAWPKQSFIEVKGKSVLVDKVSYVPTSDDEYVRTDEALVIRTGGERPKFVGSRDKWIRISVFQGSLVAFVGDSPVFVTAMSAGTGGATDTLDPSKTATLMGRFQVSWKHVTADMSGREGRSGWRVSDVPWVMYFKDSFAVHGAWWHDDFGRPKSHGCINLSPADAKRIFDWTDPPLPEGWYGVGSRQFRTGTVIEVGP